VAWEQKASFADIMISSGVDKRQSLVVGKDTNHALLLHFFRCVRIKEQLLTRKESSNSNHLTKINIYARSIKLTKDKIDVSDKKIHLQCRRLFWQHFALDGQSKHSFFHGIDASIITDRVDFINGVGYNDPEFLNLLPIFVLQNSSISMSNALLDGNLNKDSHIMAVVGGEQTMKLLKVEFKSNDAVCKSDKGLWNPKYYCFSLTLFSSLFLHDRFLW
jgi:hypothetical protein